MSQVYKGMVATSGLRWNDGVLEQKFEHVGYGAGMLGDIGYTWLPVPTKEELEADEEKRRRDPRWLTPPDNEPDAE